MAVQIVEQWVVEFANVIDAMADQRPEMTVTGNASAFEDCLWWQQPFDCAAGASLWVGAPAAAWNAVGQRVLAAAGIEVAEESEARGTWLELVKQSLGGLAMRIGERLGREVTASGGNEQAPPSDIVLVAVSLRIVGQDLPALAVGCSAALVEAMSASPRAPAPPPPLAVLDETADPDEAAELSGRACRTLDLLLDVDLPVSVSFGRTQVCMQEVLKLITGSIVELDRSISEPVDVIVNNCVIARGEVVVVEGNYGVRIHQILSRRERLQQSRKYLLPLASHRR